MVKPGAAFILVPDLAPKEVKIKQSKKNYCMKRF
jgi:hypothetical protein